MLLIPSDALKLAGHFEADGFPIRIVGGWVRDTIRGLRPKDIDFCTPATPDHIVDLCKRHSLVYLESGLKHGTVPIIYRGTVYEVTTLRVDIETDGRHAEVEFTSDWRADAARRDFTFNAMSVDPAGQLYDYFDGLRDLSQRRVSFIGDAAERIKEDYLRILRYYRFKGVIGDQLDERYTEKMITAHRAGLDQISVERIWAEMQRLLVGPNLYNVLWSMWVCGIFEQIGITTGPTHSIGRAIETSRLTNRAVTVLAALTDSPLADRWKMSREDASLLRWLQVDRNLAPPSLPELKALATDRAGHEYAIERAALYGDPVIHAAIRDWVVPTFPLTGDDLISLGYPTGEKIGRALAYLRQQWRASDYRMGRDELLAVLPAE